VIAFTGSAAVGLEILRVAAETPDDQGHVKRVVSEMGGKNCVIVDADADLDEAVPEILYSAFGFAGQKCSAAARVLVHEAIADTLAHRLTGAIEVLEVGQAGDFASEVPPVIDREAQERVLRYRDVAGDAIAASARDVPEEGWFVAPSLAVGLPEGSEVNREEIFGPLLSLTSVIDVDEAMDVIASLPFALTGGLFSRSPATVERVAARSPVGNLYINRGITGAMVGRQPFGGNRRSGVGSKAGGPDYLLQFVEPRVVTENTMRHGISVEGTGTGNP
jgi:RHH-type proline utilization regulon transcriptional repressor/proline dehydrogenase/delta 1-pyrroline-5-carboxylate dehydrogenase